MSDEVEKKNNRVRALFIIVIMIAVAMLGFVTGRDEGSLSVFEEAEIFYCEGDGCWVSTADYGEQWISCQSGSLCIITDK